jgi:DNA processing protein
MIARNLLKRYEKEITLMKIMSIKGMTPRKFYLLYEEFKDPLKIWDFVKKKHQLSFKFHNSNNNIKNFSLDIDDSYNSKIDMWVKNQVLKLDEIGAKIILFEDENYPPLLKEIFYPPPIIFYKGEKITNFSQSISIVGSRRATNYGRKVAYQLASQLSSLGITIVSGFAKGIDSSAHKGAKDEIGGTIAIFGNGLDICYPRENRDLYNELAIKGSIVSEFPFGTPPERLNFPRRNRLISGISYGVIIVEAGERSGALITASFALEQGREVFAVPGEIFNENSVGVNCLIQDGAKLVMSVDDVLEEFGLIIKNIENNERRKINKKFKNYKIKNEDKKYKYNIKGNRDRKKANSNQENQYNKESEYIKKSLNINDLIENLTDEEKKVYLSLDDFSQHIDEIMKKCDLNIAKVSNILTLLEIKGIIKCHPGNRYSKKLTNEPK